MTNASYVGDRVTAAAMRLAGVRVFTPELNSAAIWRAVQTARRQSAMVIVDQDHAGMIQQQLSTAAITDPVPPIVVMPTLDRDDGRLANASRTARQVLGLAQRDEQ